MLCLLPSLIVSIIFILSSLPRVYDELSFIHLCQLVLLVNLFEAVQHQVARFKRVVWDVFVQVNRPDIQDSVEFISPRNILVKTFI